MRFMPESLLGLAKFSFEHCQASAAKVLHLHVFQMLPNPLVRVQVRSVAWKLLQVKAPG